MEMIVLSFPTPSRREGTPSYCYKRARILRGPGPDLWYALKVVEGGFCF